MTLNDLSEKDRNEFLRVFNNDPAIIDINKSIVSMHRCRNYVQELMLRDKLEKIKQNTFSSYMAEISKVSEKVNLADIQMPEETRKELNALFIALFMACDIIDSTVRDYNEILKGVDSTLQMEQFNDIKNIINTSRDKMKFMNRCLKLDEDFIWENKCDDMYKMILNKAKAILRKKSSKEWGKNKKDFLAEHK